MFYYHNPLTPKAQESQAAHCNCVAPWYPWPLKEPEYAKKLMKCSFK